MRDNVVICCVDGCEIQARQNCFDGKPYCGKHIHHMYRHGRIVKNHRRSPNVYEVDGNIAYMIFYDNKGNYKNRAIIDVEDLDKISMFKWKSTSKGYVTTQEKLLHRFIVSAPSNMLVDHINGNPLDNRKSNLRLVSNQQNLFNTHNKGRGNNQRKGVSFRKDRGKWRAYITLNGKQKTLGLFNSEEEAIMARQVAEKEYFGDYCREEDEVK